MRRALLVLVLPLALLACGDDDDEPQDAGTTSTTSTSTSTTSTTAFDGATTPTSIAGDDIGGVALLTDVRVAADRVTFEFDDDGAPGADVGYVEQAVADGSGETVVVDGEALLQVRMAPASGVDLAGEAFEETYTGPTTLEGAGPIAEVVRTGDFEANLTWVIGLDSERPYRVLRLDAPPRIAVLFG